MTGFATDRILTRATEAWRTWWACVASQCVRERGADGSSDGQLDQRAHPGAHPRSGVTVRARLRPGLLPVARPRLGSGSLAPSVRRIRRWRTVRLAGPRYAVLPGLPLLATRRAAPPGSFVRVHSQGSSAAPAWERTADSYPGRAVAAGGPRCCWRPGARWHRRSLQPRRLSQSATAGTREEEIVSSVPGASGAILSVGALLQAAATVGRLLAAAGDPDATGHRNDGGSRPADLGGGAARAAGDGGGAAGDARGTGRGLGGRRSR